MMDAQRELRRLLTRTATSFEQAIIALAKARMGKGDYSSAVSDMAELIRETLILSNLYGRKRLLMQADAARSRGTFSAQIESPSAYGETFDEALADLVSRDPRLERSSIELSRLYNTEHVFGLAYSADLAVTKKIQETISRSVREGLGISDVAPIIEEMGPWSRSYAEVVYRTNASTAYTAGRFQIARDPDVAEVIPAMEFVALLDARTRPNHAAAHGMIAATDDPIWRQFQPPIGYSCFVPGTAVSGSFVAGLKALYSGPIVQIETRLGARLSVTVNHPVLTSLGWRRADDLAEGDCLFSHGPQIESFRTGSGDRSLSSILEGRRAVDNQDVPALIENVFESLRVHGVRSSGTRLPMFPLDLHGDARWCDGKIDVVGADRVLLEYSTDLHTQGDEEVIDPLSACSSRSSRYGMRRKATFRQGLLSSGSGDPCGSTLTLDDGPIISPDLTLRPLHPLRIAASSHPHVLASEERRYGGAADPEFIAQLLHTASGQIARDQIVRILRIPYRGHVYDLQTSTGWILSQGIVTSNCRCAAEFVSVFDLEKRGLIRNGRVMRYLPPGFAQAHPDANFKVGAGNWEGR